MAKIPELLALSGRFDDPRSPIFGLERNPDGLPLECCNCIGACCIGSTVAHTDDPAVAGQLLTEHGWIHRGFFPEHWRNISSPLRPQALLGIGSTSKLKKDPPSCARWKQAIQSMIPKLVETDRGNAYSACGPCGELTPSGNCGIHHLLRPRICELTEAGEPFCQERFTAYRSPAAMEIERILNKGLPTLNWVRRTLELPHSNQEKFNFKSNW